MPTSVTMPQLGESVAEGTIGKWLKRPGDQVDRDEAIAEVITDKVNSEVPSPIAGVLERILVPEGATVAVGQAIAIVGDGSGVAQPDVEPVAASSRGQDARAPSSTTPADVVAASPGPVAPAKASGPFDPGAVEGPRFYTPVVLRMAREHGIDLAHVEGTGLGGRVTKRDLERYLEQRGAAPLPPAAPSEAIAPPSAPAATPPAAVAPSPAPLPARGAPSADDEALPVSPIRRAIAEHMVRSVQTSPHAWSMIEVDMTEVARVRAAGQADWQRREGSELTFLPFVLKAVAEALREHPMLNATWDRDHVVLKRRINLGIAVATEDALLVPVLKDADQMSLVGLARAVRTLVQRARAGKLTLDDVQGGTFTVNNTGALGSILSQPIINQPQAAILTTEAIVKRPVVVEGDAIAIRSMMYACCSFDHRVVDGAQVLRFMQAVRRRLEAYRADTPVW